MTKRLYAPLFLAALALAALCDHPARAQKASTTPAYTFTDLGGLTGLSIKTSQAKAINDAGQIAGFSVTSGPRGGEEHPVLWHRDAAGNMVVTDLLLGGHSWPSRITGRALGINSQGEVVGYWLDAAGPGSAFLIRPSAGTGTPIWYQDRGDGLNQLIVNLNVPVFASSSSINDSTQITVGPNLAQFDASGTEIDAALSGFGTAINNSRQVAGTSNSMATVWQVDDAGNTLGTSTLAALRGYTASAGRCVDALGRVAGNSYIPATATSAAGPPHATLWQNGAAPTALRSTTDTGSDAYGISTVNGVLQVVGYASGAHAPDFAFLWKNAVLADLNALISASGVSLKYANGINTSGQIVGSAVVTVSKNNYETHGFLLTPR